MRNDRTTKKCLSTKSIQIKQIKMIHRNIKNTYKNKS